MSTKISTNMVVVYSTGMAETPVMAKNFIKNLREDRKMSMQELADRCLPPTTNQQISRLEKSQRKLTQDWMVRLAAALECHPLDLMDGGPETLKPDERALLETYRGMSENQKGVARSVVDAIKKPESGKDNGNNSNSHPKVA